MSISTRRQFDVFDLLSEIELVLDDGIYALRIVDHCSGKGQDGGSTRLSRVRDTKLKGFRCSASPLDTAISQTFHDAHVPKYAPLRYLLTEDTHSTGGDLAFFYRHCDQRQSMLYSIQKSGSPHAG